MKLFYLCLALCILLLMPGCAKAPVDSAKGASNPYKAADPTTKFDVVPANFLSDHVCHEVYHSDERPSSPSYSLYRCAGMQTDVEVDKAAVPEAAKDGMQCLVCDSAKGPKCIQEVCPTYTIIPLPKIVKIEPPPAVHHPSLPTPKDDKPRKRRKRPYWTSEYWDVSTQQMVVSHETPECIAHGLCVENADGTLSSTGGAYIANPQSTAPAMTPQQFTDWMNENLPKDVAVCAITGLPAIALNDGSHSCPLPHQLPSYPPDYKMPKGAEHDQLCRIWNGEKLTDAPCPGTHEHLSCTQTPVASFDGRIELDCTK